MGMVAQSGLMQVPLADLSRKYVNVPSPKAGREASFDLLRALAMFFICFVHFYQRYGDPSFSNSFGLFLLNTFSLSAFFFAGGYFIKRASDYKGLGIYILKIVFYYLFPAYLFVNLSIWLLPCYWEYPWDYYMGLIYTSTDSWYWYFLVAALINAFLAIFYFFLKKYFLKNEGFMWDLLRFLIMSGLSVAYSLIFHYLYVNIGTNTLASRLLIVYFPSVLAGFGLRSFLPYIKGNKLKLAIVIPMLTICLGAYIATLVLYRNWNYGMDGDFGILVLFAFGLMAGIIIYFAIAYWLCLKAKWLKHSFYLSDISGPFYLVHVFLVRLIYENFPPEISSIDGLYLTGVVFYAFGFFLLSVLTTYIMVIIPLTNAFFFGHFEMLKTKIYDPIREMKNGAKS